MNKQDGTIFHCPKMGLLEEEGMMEWEEYRKIDLTKESWGGVGGNNACTLVMYLCALLLPMGAFTLFFVRSNNARCFV